jgi:hypothetical protein
MGYGLEQLSPPPPSTLLQKLILFPPSTHTLLLQSFLLSFFCSPFSPLIPTQNSRCYQSFCHISLCLSCLSFTHPVALVPISFLRHFPLSVRPFLVLYLSVSASSLSKVLAKTRNAARELSFFCKERLATPPPLLFVCLFTHQPDWPSLRKAAARSKKKSFVLLLGRKRKVWRQFLCPVSIVYRTKAETENVRSLSESDRTQGRNVSDKVNWRWSTSTCRC